MNLLFSKYLVIEKNRDSLAKDKNYRGLRKTYGNNTIDIFNSNTGKKWDELNEKSINKSTYPMACDRLNIVTNYIKGKNLKILDIGFGHGDLEKIISNNFSCKELVGVDISGNSVKKMNKLYPKWRFIQKNISEVNLPQKRFDYVLALEVLEHISARKILKVLENIYKSIKPGGYLIITVPLNENLCELMRANRNISSHVRMYTPDLIKAELAMTGFSLVKTRLLYAFHKHYKIKSFVMRYLCPCPKKPNIIIICARKV